LKAANGRGVSAACRGSDSKSSTSGMRRFIYFIETA